MAYKQKYTKSSFPFKSPLKKDVKMYNGNGKQVTVDDSKLGKQYLDDDGNKSRDHENGDVLYTTPPRFGESKEGPVVPMGPRIIKPKRNLA